MDRRQFFRKAGAVTGGAAVSVAALAAPAIAQSNPKLKWRLASSFPKSLDTIFSASEVFARSVSEATDGNFQIDVFAGGELVPPFAIVDAVNEKTVEIGHTASYYYFGKDPTFALFTAMPFGLNSRMQDAWMYEGGGIDLMNKFYAKYGLYTLPGGNTGAQMAGWFRKEINTVDDLKGLKFRIAGIAGAIMAKLGVVPQQLAAADVYPALEKGTLDAAEFTGPYDDEKLGFYKVAKYYYYPGWWEGGAMLHFLINDELWNDLPKAYQAVITAAAGYAKTKMQARYDVQNPPAIRKLVGAGAELRGFPQEVMLACYQAAKEVYAEICAGNADFKEVHDAIVGFRGEEYLWFQISEQPFDAFMMGLQRSNAL